MSNNLTHARIEVSFSDTGGTFTDALLLMLTANLLLRQQIISTPIIGLPTKAAHHRSSESAL